MNPPVNNAERTMIVPMRFLDAGGVLTIPAIILPYYWMNLCHGFMGLGTLPDTPIVSCFARSFSARQAIVGTTTLPVSRNITCHRLQVNL